MTDALDAVSPAVETEVLGEHHDAPKPITNTVPEDAADEALSPEQKRGKAVDKAIDKTLSKKDEEKPDPKAEKQPEEKAAKEPKGKKADQPEADEAKEADKPEAEAKTQEEPAKRQSAYRDPPEGFDDAAKAEWETTPEGVRGAVHRRFQELERGIAKHRETAQEFEAVREYAEMAKQGGTDLPTALNRYTQMENALRQNPIAGLQAVVANLGLQKADGQPITLRDIAASIMGQTPNQAASQQEATISQLTQQVQSLTQQLGGFSKHVEQQQQQAKVAGAESEWSQFKARNPSAAELEPQIAEFLTRYPAPSLTAGERLQDAYDWAVSRNPSVAHTDAPPLVQTQAQSQPNPAGKKSISGAPGGNDAKSAPRNLSRSAAVDKAMRAAGL